MLNSRFLKGASLLALSQLTVAASTFLRNIIVARHISVADYGIATTFALTMSLLEMTSNLALDRILVQDEDGASDAMLASSHVMQFAKGLLTGCLLFLLASPVAYLFDLPELIWAFQLLALIPMIRGLVHWDTVVRQREMNFAPTALVDALPPLAGVAVAYLAALWLGDYRVMLVVVLCQVLLTTVLSHLLARRPYRWLLRRDLLKKKFDFGWPLLVNGLLMFAIFQGDRVVIGALYDMHTLGWYSVAFSLALLPTLIIAKVSGYLLMPLLSRSRADREQYQQQCNFAVSLCFAAGGFMVCFFAVAGNALLLLSFGERYLQAKTVLMLLCIMQAIRIIRVAPAIIANSQAKTKNAMYANIFRTTALLLALLAGWLGYPVTWIAISGIVGELLALYVSFRLVELEGFKLRFVLRALALGAGFVLISALALLAYHLLGDSRDLLTNALQLVGGSLAGLLAALVLLGADKALWRQLRGLRR